MLLLLAKTTRYRLFPPADANNAKEGKALGIRPLLTGWLVLTAVFMLLSYAAEPYFADYTVADNDFAHSLAGEMLADLEQIYIDADSVLDKDRQQRLADGESRFAGWKYAATHFKGRLAEDFVYAFALAEDGCRLALQAGAAPGSYRRRSAAERFRRAREQFGLIADKDYRQHCRTGG
ncbi:MAG: hypothetical protein P4N41_03840 [Negativicutes bacterium]|nr:hypothetical protein [Negativicutes bacterium]